MGRMVSKEDIMPYLAPGERSSRPSMTERYWLRSAASQYGQTPSQNSNPESIA